ncbi:MAG: hypothetical protein HRU19_25850 [Pseudobacteriovorax sp.]|nr:hypothetical protein [Pseudobacteriovorax sp.]
MSVCSAFLVPHTPEIISKIGKEKEKLCQTTIKGMETVVQSALSQEPDQIVIISPHTPRLPDKIGVISQRLTGNFSGFGHPEVKVTLPSEEFFSDEIVKLGSRYFEALPRTHLDHGALVPLWFFQKGGWSGNTTILSLPARYSEDMLVTAGNKLGQMLEKDPQNIIVIASGELSHTLAERSPLPQHKDAKEFDETIRKIIISGHLNDIEKINEGLIENAAEDCYETLFLLAAILNKTTNSPHIISYEAPFGVGLCVAAVHQSAA